MDDKELIALQDRYKNALLYKQEAKIHNLYDQLSKEKTNEEDFFHQAELWAAACHELGEKAIEAVHAGAKRDSLAFDELSAHAVALGGNAKTYFCAIFDRAIEELLENSQKAVIDAVASNTVSCQYTAGFLMQEINKLVSWGKRGKTQLNHYLNELKTYYPEKYSKALQIVERGELLVSFKTRAMSKKTNIDSLVEEMKQKGFGEYEIQTVRKMRDKHAVNQEIKRNLKTISIQNTPVTSSPAQVLYEELQYSELSLLRVHPNSIPELAPAKKWTILFDETGTNFKESAFDENTSDIALGRMVALVVPEYTQLPALSHFHATESPLSAVREKLLTIRNSRCGVIGLPVNALQRIHAEQWFACIETTLDLILRLLPVDGETTLSIQVEQRGKANPQNSFILQKTCDDCLFHLSRAFPERSKAITLESRIITKDDNPWNGYVDAIAFSWSSPNGSLLLQETGWENTCLINQDSSLLTSYIDIMEREDRLSPEEWNRLLGHQNNIQTNSLAGALLRNIGERSRDDIALWQNYMQYVLRHLNSKAINLYKLGTQVSWLKQWQPEEGKLSPKLRLIWLTVKLAEENHKGITNSYPDQRAEFNKLSLELFLEDAPFACNAALHLAVSYTNEFDFEGARSVLSFWDNHPAEVPGLQYYGQLLSSHGQHEAFMGNFDEAIKYFHDAIDAFERLSVQEIANSDISQTRAYLITALMDSEKHDEELAEQIKLYYGTNLEEAALQLAGSKSDADKYRHHILLRYLVQKSTNEYARKNYLSQKNDWQLSDGHPWEMIEFYRAMLCDDQEEKLIHLRKAYDIAKCGGLTLQVIAAVILGSIYFYDESVKQEFEKLVQYVRSSLPKLGERGKVLERQLRNIEPLDFAKLVLPFNFR